MANCSLAVSSCRPSCKPFVVIGPFARRTQSLTAATRERSGAGRHVLLSGASTLPAPAGRRPPMPPRQIHFFMKKKPPRLHVKVRTLNLPLILNALQCTQVHCHEADVTAEPRSLLLSNNTHREPFNELMLTCLRLPRKSLNSVVSKRNMVSSSFPETARTPAAPTASSTNQHGCQASAQTES